MSAAGRSCEPASTRRCPWAVAHDIEDHHVNLDRLQDRQGLLPVARLNGLESFRVQEVMDQLADMRVVIEIRILLT